MMEAFKKVLASIVLVGVVWGSCYAMKGQPSRPMYVPKISQEDQDKLSTLIDCLDNKDKNCWISALSSDQEKILTIGLVEIKDANIAAYEQILSLLYLSIYRILAQYNDTLHKKLVKNASNILQSKEFVRNKATDVQKQLVTLLSGISKEKEIRETPQMHLDFIKNLFNALWPVEIKQKDSVKTFLTENVFGPLFIDTGLQAITVLMTHVVTGLTNVYKDISKQERLKKYPTAPSYQQISDQVVWAGNKFDSFQTAFKKWQEYKDAPSDGDLILGAIKENLLKPLQDFLALKGMQETGFLVAFKKLLGVYKGLSSEKQNAIKPEIVKFKQELVKKIKTMRDKKRKEEEESKKVQAEIRKQVAGKQNVNVEPLQKVSIKKEEMEKIALERKRVQEETALFKKVENACRVACYVTAYGDEWKRKISTYNPEMFEVFQKSAASKQFCKYLIEIFNAEKKSRYSNKNGTNVIEILQYFFYRSPNPDIFLEYEIPMFLRIKGEMARMKKLTEKKAEKRHQEIMKKAIGLLDDADCKNIFVKEVASELELEARHFHLELLSEE